MIQVEELSKRYGRTLAVDNISFATQGGEILGFLGKNGAGKTTTMRVLTGFLPPSSGRVQVAGYDVVEQPLEVKRRVGYLPEVPPLYPEMTVAEYLGFVGRIKGVSRQNLAARLDDSLEKSALTEVRNTIIGKLSKGFRQRVGLAQAIIHEPAILVLDEPTAGLDPSQVVETRELIRSLGGERTIILSTHILSEVEAVCQRVIIINEGRLVADDTTDHLRARQQGQAVVYLEADGPAADVRERLERVAGVARLTTHGAGATDGRRAAFDIQVDSGHEVRGELARAVVQGGWNLLEMRTVGASLEDIFRELTKAEKRGKKAKAKAEPEEAEA